MVPDHQSTCSAALSPAILLCLALGLARTAGGQQVVLEQPLGAAAFTRQDSGCDASLRGLAAVSSRVAWASGSGGTVLRTVDGGTTWNSVAVKEAVDLDFRDVHAFDADQAIVLSAGAPARIYRTTNGGQNWQGVYENDDERIFFDAMEFWDRQRGIAFSDPIDGRLVLIRSQDGGRTWNALDRDSRPATFDGEAGFAASGTCLAVRPGGRVWIGLGGAHGADSNKPPVARVLRSSDFGTRWSTSATPLPSTESSGVFSLAMANDRFGVAVGGNYEAPQVATGNAARTNDGGKSWLPPTGDPPRGYRSGVAVFGRQGRRMFIAVGTSGCDYSIDAGDSWQPLCDQPLHAVAFAADGSAGWGSGADGTIVAFDVERLAFLLPSY